MDEDSIKYTINSEGIAGLWMKNRMREGSREDQVSLGALIEGVIAEGVRKGKRDAIIALQSAPTIGAAIAVMEADIVELERAIEDKNENGVDFDVWSN